VLLQVRASEVLPWRSLAGVATAALVSALPALWLRAELDAPPLVAGAVIATTYGITYSAIVAIGLGLSPAAVGRHLGWLGTEGR
jgi:hypothetical protein